MLETLARDLGRSALAGMAVGLLAGGVGLGVGFTENNQGEFYGEEGVDWAYAATSFGLTAVIVGSLVALVVWVAIQAARRAHAAVVEQDVDVD